ncbi:hypothetical protein ACSBR2_032062 [Camellia fascicularis]
MNQLLNSKGANTTYFQLDIGKDPTRLIAFIKVDQLIRSFHCIFYWLMCLFVKVSSIGVTGAHVSVSGKVQTLLQDIKEATSKPVAVGFGISKPEHVKQMAGWGADGVIVGSAMVKLLGEAKSPEEGLKELEIFTKSLKSALP